MNILAKEIATFTYVSVDWIHSHPDEPYKFFCELDSQRYETRKLVFYKNEAVGYASEHVEHLDFLSPEPYPDDLQYIFDQSNDYEVFVGTEIGKEVFELLWDRYVK